MNTKNEVLIAGICVSATVEIVGKAGKELGKIRLEVDPPGWMRNAKGKDIVEVQGFGSVVEDVKKLTPGTPVSIEGRVTGREFNGKFYTSVMLNKITVLPREAAPVAPPAPSDDNDDGVPF